jgi:hypothetical protein
VVGWVALGLGAVVGTTGAVVGPGPPWPTSAVVFVTGRGVVTGLPADGDAPGAPPLPVPGPGLAVCGPEGPAGKVGDAPT